MIEAFERVRMIEMLEEIRAPRTHFLDTYFTETETFDTESVKFEVKTSKRRLAPFTRPESQGHLVEKTGVAQKTVTPAYVKPKMSYTPKEMQRRMPGQSIESSASAEDRLATDLADLQDMVVRREEFMAARQLQDGTLEIKGDGYDETIDFLVPADHKVTLSGASQWSDNLSNPITDLQRWSSMIAQTAGLTANRVTLGRDVAEAFQANANVQKYMDLQRMSFGEVNVGGVSAQGVRPIASLFGGSLIVESYDEWYYDEATDAEVPVLDVDKLVLGSTAARATRFYGAVLDFDAAENGVYQGRWFPKSWIKKDPSQGYLMLQSAPLPAMIQVNGFVSVTAL